MVKPHHEEAWRTACELATWFAERGIKTVGEPLSQSEKFAGNINFCDISAVESGRIDENVDLLVVLGGDGTMIATARIVGDRDTPVLGINYGSLGYLTEFRIEEMFAALEVILAGKYELDRRVSLRVEHVRGEETL